jgi:hypothetical protein
MGLSLLARNFNQLWINGFKQGADVFILHHSDILVESPYAGVSWVDLLVDRMYQLNAAILSVASPIKSKHGHFSMGIDLEAGNPYSLRRTTQRELLQLPRMFIGKYDICDLYGIPEKGTGPMVVNTGVWCMDLKRFPWFQLRWPGFHIVDSIEWSLDGVPQAFTEPEDWYNSRWLAKYKLPYFATREILLHHHGGHDYTNFEWWGDLHDNTPVQPSIEEWRGMMRAV